MYGETDARYDQICTIMSRDRFELIKRNIHFNDNNKEKRKQDKNIDRLSQEPEEYISIDEQMIHCKGKSVLRCNMPNKPDKWWFKVFSQSATSVMLYDITLERAPDPIRKEQIEELGYCETDVIMRLCSSLPKQRDISYFLRITSHLLNY